MKYKVWVCKIVVAEGEKTPPGFDSELRTAAVSVVESRGVQVLSCASGWYEEPAQTLDDITLGSEVS
jgi:hypothetical protein